MSNPQLDLPIHSGAADSDLELTAADLAALTELLRLNGWTKAAEIETRLGWTNRKVRAVARASGGHVLSYPGSPGYKLTFHATVEEIKAAHALRHQADDMLARWLEIEKVYHAKTITPV